MQILRWKKPTEDGLLSKPPKSTLPIKPMLWTKGFILPNCMYWNLTLKVMVLGSVAVSKSWGHSLTHETSTLTKEDRREPLCFHHVKEDTRRHNPGMRAWPLSRCWVSWHLELGLFSLQNCNNFMLFICHTDYGILL
jgi:hypothetical protein